MKRYSISTSTDGRSLTYSDRTDNPSEAIERFKKWIENWKAELNNEEYEYRELTPYKKRMRITDSKTKEIIFDETHTSEEFGWKSIIEVEKTEYSAREVHKFERI